MKGSQTRRTKTLIRDVGDRAMKQFVARALAVALRAQKEGLANEVRMDQIDQRIRSKIWVPKYLPYRRDAEQHGGAAPAVPSDKAV
jgi:hypothetical protein